VTVFGRVRDVRNATIESPEVPMSSSAILDFLDVQPNASGKAVTEVTALGMAAVWRAVQVSSNVPASLPFHAYRKDGDRRVLATGQSARTSWTTRTRT
jgi:phage portal protein BeeE